MAKGVYSRSSPEERFWKSVECTVLDDDCWNWTKTLAGRGYGQLWGTNRHVKAHRFSYELLVGEIPPGLDIDHLCNNRQCVNPSHLVPATRRDNVLRGTAPSAINARKTHCLNGHEFNVVNTYNFRDKRECRACRNAASLRFRTRKALQDG